jgi:4-amino-4-deoxy-L-arabinose transferase-like glycosyltransferase
MASSFAHRAPWWFYLAYLPLMLAPWLLWPRWWRGLHRGLLAESGLRLALLVALVGLVAFSLISGKRWHYLLPQFPMFALIVARALSGSAVGRRRLLLPALGLAAVGVGAVAATPRLAAGLGGLGDARALYWAGAAMIAIAAALLTWRPRDALGEVRAVATATILSAVALLAAADVVLRQPYDVQAVATEISRVQAAGRPVAVNADYHGQWHLAGRLRQPLIELPSAEVPQWLAQHPEGRVVFIHRRDELPPPGTRVEFEQPRYRGGRLAIVAAP